MWNKPKKAQKQKAKPEKEKVKLEEGPYPEHVNRDKLAEKAMQAFLNNPSQDHYAQKLNAKAQDVLRKAIAEQDGEDTRQMNPRQMAAQEKKDKRKARVIDDKTRAELEEAISNAHESTKESGPSEQSRNIDF